MDHNPISFIHDIFLINNEWPTELRKIIDDVSPSYCSEKELSQGEDQYRIPFASGCWDILASVLTRYHTVNLYMQEWLHGYMKIEDIFINNNGTVEVNNVRKCIYNQTLVLIR